MPIVDIIAGSKSDKKFVKRATDTLTELDFPHRTKVLSAHRDKEELGLYLKNRCDASYFISVAGLAAALPGSIAVDTDKPVIAAPVWSGSGSSPGGLDALLAGVQMPPPKDGKNVALASVGINVPENAALFLDAAEKGMCGKFKYDVSIMCPNEELGSYVEKLQGVFDELEISYKVKKGPIAEFKNKSRFYILISDNWKKREDVANFMRENHKPLIIVPVISDMSKHAFDELAETDFVTVDAATHALREIYNQAPRKIAPAVSVGYGNVKNAAYFTNRILRGGE